MLAPIDMFVSAVTARERAYAPYSAFKVGAALRDDRGVIITGANVENAAYPQGQCAEAAAIGSMIADGGRLITELVVVGGEVGDGGLCTPCGGCRQRICEFSGPDTIIWVCGPEGVRRRFTLEELLPFSFGPKNLLPQQETAKRTAVMQSQPHAAADAVRNVSGDFQPRLAMVLGSGLGDVAAMVDNPMPISYASIPGFAATTVTGHAGKLVLGEIAGCPVLILSGRRHLYEGITGDAITTPIRMLKLLGIEGLLLTCSAGSLDPGLLPGQLMQVTDHLNFQGTSVLAGPESGAFGPRFPSMEAAWDPELTSTVAGAAKAIGVPLSRGVYAAMLGPQFETPAEIRMLKILGADAVGMSMVQECIAARHCGLPVAGLAAITNMAVGLSQAPVTHDLTLRGASDSAGDLRRLILAFVQEFARG